MDLFFWVFGSVLVVSLISFIGVFTLSFGEHRVRKILLYLVSFSAGALFGDSFLHLLPQAFQSEDSALLAPISVLAGILVFFVLEKIVHWHHHHTLDKCEHTAKIKVFGINNLIGDGLHNFVDGVVIAGSFLVSIPLGVTTTLAVILHEIPQEISDFGVLLHAGFSVKKALFFNFLSALIAMVGAGVIFFAHDSLGFFGNLNLFLVPFTAGGFIYIAGADLVPELQKETAIGKTILQFLFLVLGILVMVGLRFLE
ncbi:MAG: ZIP family metal transporter [Candidatus Micrarchaeota archaeon]